MMMVTWPLAWLEGYSGYLHADAGSSYDAVYRQGAPGTIIEVACWAHARRKFFDAKETDSIRSAQMLGMVRRARGPEQHRLRCVV